MERNGLDICVCAKLYKKTLKNKNALGIYKVYSFLFKNININALVKKIQENWKYLKSDREGIDMNLIPVPSNNSCVIIMTLITTIMQIKLQCLTHFMSLHSIFQMLS